MYKIMTTNTKHNIEFVKKYGELKKKRNIVDFGDIEHFALQILLKKKKMENHVKTEVSKEYMNKFFRNCNRRNTKTVTLFKNIY